MKKLLLFALLAFAFTGTALAQQALIMGKWSGQFTDQDGKPLKFAMTITADTYQFDMGLDGTVDMTGAYTSEGDQITIWDTSGQNVCPADQKGVYKFALDGDALSFTKVSDACPGRGNEVLVVKRM